MLVTHLSTEPVVGLLLEFWPETGAGPRPFSWSLSLLLYKGRVVFAGLTSAGVDGNEGVSVLGDAVVDCPSITPGAAGTAVTGTPSI